MRAARCPCALVPRRRGTAIMLGAYIFDCAKHGAVFDRQLIKSMSLAGKAVFVWEQSLKSSVRSVVSQHL